MDRDGTQPGSTDVAALDAFTMVPVAEFTPGQFSERATPTTCGYRADPDGWHAWWVACLGDAGITGLEPVAHGSWFVPLAQLTGSGVLAQWLDAEIGHVASDALAEIERAAAAGGDAAVALAEEYLLPVSGGLALVVDGVAALEPGCCCDLGNIAEWDLIASAASDEWTDLWIGHPYPMARAEAGRVLLSDAVYPEESASERPRWVLDRARLVAELARARAELGAFAGRLAPVVSARFGSSSDVAERIARHLAGLGAAAAHPGPISS